VDLLVIPGQVSEVAVDGEMPAFLLLVDVEGTGPVVDGTLATGRAGGEKQGVGKAGLARRPCPARATLRISVVWYVMVMASDLLSS
jgi:hypothetical protein